MPKSKVRKKKNSNRSDSRASINEKATTRTDVRSNVVKSPDDRYSVPVLSLVRQTGISDLMASTNPNMIAGRTGLPASIQYKLKVRLDSLGGPNGYVEECPVDLSHGFILPNFLLMPEFKGREYTHMIPSVWAVIGNPSSGSALFMSGISQGYKGFTTGGTVEENNKVLWQNLTQMTREAEVTIYSDDPDTFFNALPTIHSTMMEMFEAYTIAVTGKSPVPNTTVPDIFTNGIVEILFGNPYYKHGFDFFITWLLRVYEPSRIDFNIATIESVAA